METLGIIVLGTFAMITVALISNFIEKKASKQIDHHQGRTRNAKA